MSDQLSMSEIKTYQSCPSLWGYKYIARRGTFTDPDGALTRGSLTHAALHKATLQTWKGSPPELIQLFLTDILGAYNELCIIRNVEPRDETIDRLTIAGTRAAIYWADYGSHARTLGSEVVLSSTRYRGIVDAIEEDDEGGIWARQYKTIGSLRWAPSIIRLVKRSLHESVYKDLMIENGHSRYRGTRLVLIPLDPLHSRQAGSLCPHCGSKGLSWRHLDLRPIDLSINGRILEQRALDLLRVGTAIQLSRMACEKENWPLSGGPPPLEQRGESTGACISPYGNRDACPYMGICDRDAGADLFDSNSFTDIDPDSRYHEET